MINYTVLN